MKLNGGLSRIPELSNQATFAGSTAQIEKKLWLALTGFCHLEREL
jgi:hypothetical protein